MARITEEQIEQINEVYRQTRNKALTARTVGVSAATVNKYLRDDYVPKDQRVETEFQGEEKGSQEFINKLVSSVNPIAEFFAALALTDDEWADMKELSKEIYL